MFDKRNIMIALFCLVAPLAFVACDRSESDVQPLERPRVQETVETDSPPPAERSTNESQTESEQDGPRVSFEISTGSAESGSFSNLAQCAAAAIRVAGRDAQCEARCRCYGDHPNEAPETQESCMLSCDGR